MNAGPFTPDQESDSPLAKPKGDQVFSLRGQRLVSWPQSGIQSLNNGWRSTQKYPSNDGRDIARVRNNRSSKGEESPPFLAHQAECAPCCSDGMQPHCCSTPIGWTG